MQLIGRREARCAALLLGPELRLGPILLNDW